MKSKILLWDTDFSKIVSTQKRRDIMINLELDHTSILEYCKRKVLGMSSTSLGSLKRLLIFGRSHSFLIPMRSLTTTSRSNIGEKVLQRSFPLEIQLWSLNFASNFIHNEPKSTSLVSTNYQSKQKALWWLIYWDYM